MNTEVVPILFGLIPSANQSCVTNNSSLDKSKYHKRAVKRVKSATQKHVSRGGKEATKGDAFPQQNGSHLQRAMERNSYCSVPPKHEQMQGRASNNAIHGENLGFNSLGPNSDGGCDSGDGRTFADGKREGSEEENPRIQ
ncbi:hypothetical protein K7X08_035416 [Anisodus acutangulus]|uniref:Uncharacterized protein n=1 Tax=Anisodus acutangulus TaxID=402998 RepID=A0A9Q1R0L3_9SOLA|nr:hypothetical protein K7X08_035416 [Anisodus acutangulus]